MVIQRDVGFVRIIKEPFLSRINNRQCPVCAKPKNEWTRRTDWRCCSTDCTEKFDDDCCIIRSWADLRKKVFERDNHTCVKCKRKGGTSTLIGDHIIPIALGGEQWEEDNIQTLCIYCDKIKTKEDHGNIAKQRKIEKLRKGNHTLSEGTVTKGEKK